MSVRESERMPGRPPPGATRPLGGPYGIANARRGESRTASQGRCVPGAGAQPDAQKLERRQIEEDAPLCGREGHPLEARVVVQRFERPARFTREALDAERPLDRGPLRGPDDEVPSVCTLVGHQPSFPLTQEAAGGAHALCEVRQQPLEHPTGVRGDAGGEVRTGKARGAEASAGTRDDRRREREDVRCEQGGFAERLGRALVAAQGGRARDAQASVRRCCAWAVHTAVAIGALVSCHRDATDELLGTQVALLPVSEHRPPAAKARVARVALSVAAQAHRVQSAGLTRDGHRSRHGSSSIALAA